MSKTRLALVLSAPLTAAVVTIALCVGSGTVGPAEILAVVAARARGLAPPDGPIAGIVWDLRLPRVLLAWIAGAALSVSGAIMQSLLKNPLASPFTVGVSSGASLGAGLVILSGLSLPFLGALTVPVAGFLCAVGTAWLVLRFSRAIDPLLEGSTIVLVGMVLSLFVNAILTAVSAASGRELARLVIWQMGSFALRGWGPIAVLFPLLVASTALAFLLRRELDAMTFGDEEARALGVPTVAAKRVLVGVVSVLTGATVSFVGVIGFLDLAVPQAVRRLVGPGHRALIPFSAIAGGAFMVLADLAARVALSPLDLPVGAVTALVGAPVFALIFLGAARGRI